MKAKFSLATILALQLSAAHAAYSPVDVSENPLKKGVAPFSLTKPGLNTSADAAIGSVIAINQGSYVGDKYYPAATEFVVGADSELFAVTSADADPVATGVKLSALPQAAYTLIDANDAIGELLAFNIPGDFMVAGGGGHRRGRGGVTNCYHVAKAVLSRKIHLDGVAAYSAAPQLQAAGWQRYDYGSAPKGAACVFGAGGKVTSSGGNRYGHIGIKGYGGIINPASGFALGRPFLGCWSKA